MQQTRVAAVLGLALLTLSAAACTDDSTSLDKVGTPSDVRVRAYLDVNGDGAYDAGDDALAGVTVTMTNTLTDKTLTAETDANGLATFADVPAGAYDATLDEADLPAGLTDVSIVDPGLDQTIVAPFEGDEDGVDASFRFRYMPATITGTVWVDTDRSGDFDPAIDDTPASGTTVYLFAGSDTTGTPTDSAEADGSGVFAFGVYPGSYALLVRGDDQTEVVTDMPITLDVASTDSVDVTILVRTAVTTIANARQQPDGTSVTVEGVVSVGSGNISGSYFWLQDNSGAGIKIFTGSTPESYQPGDSLQIRGSTTTFSGEKEIAPDAIDRLGTGAIPQPVDVSAAEFATNAYQGLLVRVDSLTVDSMSTGSSYNVFVSNGSAEFVIRVDSDTGIGAGAFQTGGTYTVTGVSSPFGGNEQLYPRSSADIFRTDGGANSIAAARGAPDSTDVTVRGVVTVGRGNISSSYFWLEDGTAGVKVFIGSSWVGSYAAGDSLEVQGTTVTFSGEKEIEASTITALGTGTIPGPTVVTGAELESGAYEGSLLTVQTVTVDSMTSGGSYNVFVTDDDADATSFIVRIDSDAAITTTFTAGTSYTITGVSSPFGGAQQLYPRSDADITTP